MTMPPPGTSPHDPEAIYRDLRSRALGARPEEIGIEPAEDDDRPYGALMETGYPNGVATLAAFATGDASLYFSSGGGVIGGIGHEAVHAAARRLVNLANEFLPAMEKVAEYPLPAAGAIRFYAVTPRGVFTVAAGESDLGEQRHPFSPLFYAAHDVITELRLLTQQGPG